MNRTDLDFDYALDVREDTTDGVAAVIYGRAVPYDTPTTVSGVSESFAPNSIDPADVIGKPLAWRHDNPIGVITAAENQADGLYITADILDSTQGRDAALLAKRGAVKGLSIGFQPVKSTWNKARTAVRHELARVLETSLTHMPAYPTAGIASVREEGEPMPEVTQAEAQEAPVIDAEAREAIGKLQQRIDATVHVAEPVHPLAKFRSFGDYSQAVLAGELETRALYDQVTGDNEGVLPPTWMLQIKNIVDLGRPGISAFGVQAAGASGMTYNWPYYNGNLADIVEEQANEKTEVNSVQISFLKGTANLQTWGAASDISFQLLQRSNPSYLEGHNRVMAASYALVTDAAFCSAVMTASTAYSYDITSDTDGSAFREAVFGASVDVQTATGLTAEFVLVAPDVFKKIGGWSTFYPAQYGTFNVSGTAAAGTLGVAVSGLPVILDRQLTGNQIVVSNSSCAKWIEDGPSLASVDDVAKLGRDVAIYGYGAPAIFNAAGIVSLED